MAESSLRLTRQALHECWDAYEDIYKQGSDLGKKKRKGVHRCSALGLERLVLDYIHWHVQYYYLHCHSFILASQAF